MPEGHTIHRLANDLRRTLSPGPIAASSPQGRFAPGATLLDGAELKRAEAWGKYLFCTFSNEVVLHIHLGLIGKFRPAPIEEAPSSTIRLRLENQTDCWHLTGPARCELITRHEQRLIVGKLGPDPLRARSSVAQFRDNLARTRLPIGAALLDQSVIAGIGNVYRAEVLFLCGIHPGTPSNTLSSQAIDELWATTKRLLQRGVRLNRIITTGAHDMTRPISQRDGDDRLYVYHRTNCRWCGTELTTLHLGGRPIQFCPHCQPH